MEIHTTDMEEIIEAYATMDELEGQLGGGFYRRHRGYRRGMISHLIVLDENGEMARFRASSHGGNITGPTEEEMRQFEAEQAAKKKRREEYARLNEESALKHKLMEQETDARYYQTSITKKAVSAAAYEAAAF